eukprot:scaffold249816_cov14-Tisochrysis_lutea.AAC.2
MSYLSKVERACQRSFVKVGGLGKPPNGNLEASMIVLPPFTKMHSPMTAALPLSMGGLCNPSFGEEQQPPRGNVFS